MRSGDHYLRREFYAFVSESASGFAFLEECALDGVWYWDLERPDDPWISPRFWRALGYDPVERADDSPRSWRDLVEPDDVAAVIEAIARHGADASVACDQVIRYRHQSGSTVWMRCRGVATRDATGRPLRMIAAQTDLTEQMRRERAFEAESRRLEHRNLELQALVERAAETERRTFEARSEHERLFETSLTCLATASLDGWLLELNPAWERVLGWTRDELRSRPYLELVHPEDREPTMRAASGLAQGHDAVQFENRYQAKDGSYRWLLWNSSADLARERVYAVAHDVTERRRAESALVEARARAEQAAHAKSEFLAHMSHEIRTPLNAVIGFTNLLLESPLEPQQAKHLRMVQASGEHLLTIIDDILDFSKVEAGHLDFEHVPFDLRACIESSIDLVAGEAARNDIELTFELASRPPVALLGDAGRLRQIVVNLLANAVKFTERGDVHVQARTESVGDGRYEVQIEVRDTGIGIPPERMADLFQPFQQLDASTARRFGGTGLGLVITRRLLEAMGGQIEVESTPGVGSVFRCKVTLDASSVPLGLGTHPAAASLAGRRVLIVGERGASRAVLARHLAGWGTSADEANSPSDALRAIASGARFDAAIVDLPARARHELERELRGRARARALPVITLDAFGAGRPAAAEGGSVGVFVSKPVKPAELFDALVGSFAAAAGEHQDTPTPIRSVAATVAPTAPPRAATQHGLRILLAEDNAMNQAVFLSLLEVLGYEADVVADGEAAIAALERKRYDVVLMDVQMPRLDGIEATRRIVARWPAHERPRIVALTAHAMGDDRRECLDAGMDDYLSKPIELSRLASALSHCRVGGA